MSGVNLLTSGLKKPPQKQRLSTPFPLSPSKDLNDNNNNNHNIINNNKNSNNNNNNNNNNEKEISNKKIISTFALNLSLAKPQVGVFVPPDIPPPLELTEEEAKIKIELPSILPGFPNELIPPENQDINLPAIICNIQSPKINNSPFKNSKRTKDMSDVENIPIMTSRSRTNTLPDYASLNLTFNNLFSNEMNTRKSSDANLLLKSQNALTPSFDLSFNGSTLINTIPEGEEEDLKRSKRKIRVGRSYQSMDDDQLLTLQPIDPREIEEIRQNGFSFTEYANKYFKDNKSYQKKKIQFSSLISHSKKLTTSLHNFEQSKDSKLSLDLFKKIKFYMLDKKSLDKQMNEDPLIIAQQIIDTAISSSHLHDEIYSQVIKQLCNNPSKSSEGRGWELLSYIICSFPPRSGELCQSLKTWLVDQVVRNQDSATFCYHSLQRTLSRSTSRKRAPSILELQYLRDRAQIVCRMVCSDGSQTVVNIDSSVTTDKVFHTFCDRNKIDYPYRDSFKLLISCDNDERQVEPGVMVDCIRQLEILYNLNSSKFELSHCKFFVKQKIFLRRRLPISSDVVIRLLFAQVKQEILSGALVCKQEKEIIEITSILLQHELGDYDQSKNIKLDQYLPPKALSIKNDLNYWLDKIKSSYFGLMDTSKVDCRKKFVSIAQKLLFFGCSFYDIDFVNAPEMKYSVDVKKLMINEDGITFFNDDLSSTADRYPFEDIINMNIKNDTHIELVTKKHFTLKFSCKIGYEIIKEMNAYVAAFMLRSSSAIAIEDHVFPDTEENKDLLSFKKGDNIKVYIPNDGNNWEYGGVNQQTGNYPANLVKHLWVTANNNSSRVILLEKSI